MNFVLIDIGDTSTIGIVDECCYKACKISQMTKYCN
jgi:hypothetical protein